MLSTGLRASSVQRKRREVACGGQQPAVLGVVCVSICVCSLYLLCSCLFESRFVPPQQTVGVAPSCSAASCWQRGVFNSQGQGVGRGRGTRRA